MKVSKGIFEAFLEEYFQDSIVKEGDEWRLPSFENPSKQKCYVNVEKGTAVDFIGNKGYSARTFMGRVVGIEGREELDNFIMDFTMKHIKKVDLRDMLEVKHIIKEPPPPVQKIPLPEGCVDILSSIDAKNYLFGRGIAPSDIKKYHLTFCTKDRFKNRIIIPFIENGEIIWYQGRAIKNWMPRYDNPPGVEKSMIVYNIDSIKSMAIITEGPFDAITVGGQAIMGSSMSEWQAMKILAKNPSKIIIVPDNDYNRKKKTSPGYNGALRTVEMLLDKGYNISDVYVTFLTEGKDLAALGKKAALQAIENAEPFTLSTLAQFRMFFAESEILMRMI